MLVGLGIFPAFWPFRNRDREMQSAVASSIGSQSRTTEVCVAFLQRNTGARGSDSPKEEKMASWREVKEACSFCSEVKFLATVISTILPEEIFGGSNMDGNSI
jgi:hypothetical protein